MENLKVIYLKGNEIIKTIQHYRKTLINKLKSLTYLDDRPVDEGDRLGSEAFFRGGLEEERKVRDECRRMKDTGYKIRKMEDDKEKVSFEERKEKAMKAVKNEYLKKKEYLENKKRKLIQEYQKILKQDLTAIRDKTREIIAVDYQMKENEKLKVEEEQEIVFSMAKREKHNTYSIFEYQDWMDPILINNVAENMFDFPIALKLIQLDLKNRNVPNYDLLNVLELRSRWTDIELNHFRKVKSESNENIENIEKNNEILQLKLSEKLMNAEKDKRIIMSTIKEAKIDESVFMDAVGIGGNVDQKHKDDDNHEDVNKDKEERVSDQVKKENKKEKENGVEVNGEEKGFKLQITEEDINFSQLD